MRLRVRSVVVGAAALAATAAARSAFACPTCVNGRNLEYLKLGALLSIVPFAVVAMVLWVLRHAPRDERTHEPR
jgi:hypothetical protein